MPGTINTLETFGTVDFTSADSPGRGMAFKSPSDGNIYIAIVNTTFLALNKTTGAVVFATNANDQQFKTNWNAASDSFLNSSAGGFPNFTIAAFSGLGVLTGNPATGKNPYGAIIAAGNYYAGDTGDTHVTILNAATGAPVGSTDTGIMAPTSGVGQWADDGASIWCTAINSYLIELNRTTGALLNVYDMTLQGVGRISGMCFAMGFLWLVDAFGGTIVKCDLAGHVISTTPATDSGPLIFDGTYFWLLGSAINVLDNTAALQALKSLPATAQDVAHDPADGAGIVWVTSGGPPSQVQKFQFVPGPALTGGRIMGHPVAIVLAGQVTG